MKRYRVLFRVLPLVLVAATMTARSAEKQDPRASLIVVAGAGGEKDYDASFTKWAEEWRDAGVKGGARVTTIGLPGSGDDDIAALRAALQQEPAESASPLWLVLLGHGTHDGRDAKFNLRGADLAVSELAEWLKPMQRPVVVIGAFSASGAFLAPLSAPGRSVVTATKSGGENNYARFGQYFSAAITDTSADLDHDGQTSLLEAWLGAAQQVATFYKSEGRLATEHALLDDNGDGRGTPADWFQGIRVVKKSKDNAVPDGVRAHQMHLVPSAAEREMPPAVRTNRDAIELEIAQLRAVKSTMAEEEFYAKIEAVMLRLARIYRETGSARRD